MDTRSRLTGAAGLAASAWLALAAAACGANGPDPIPFCQASTRVLFDPAGDWLLPFPSDLYTTPDGASPTGLRLHFTPDNLPPGDKLFQQYPEFVQQLDQLDGFGTTAAVAFGFSDEIGDRDQVDGEWVTTPPPSLDIGPGATIAVDSPAVLIDITPGSPTAGQSVPVMLEYISDEDKWGHGQHMLLVEPAFPLRPKTTYAAALTTRLTDLGGGCLAPSAATQALLSGDGLERFGRLGEQAPVAVAALIEVGFIAGPDELSALTVFTTQSIEEPTLAAVEQILQRAEAPGYRVVDGSLVASPESDGAALKVTGRFEALSFQTDAGTFEVNESRPVVQAVEELEFELVLPEPTPEHPGPFPIIVYQHGLLGQKGEDMGAKRAQARAGFASLAIDAPLHGTRAAETGWEVTNFFAIDLDTGQFDMPVLRDNFRQAFLDVVQLTELVPALAKLDLLPDGAPDGQPEIAPAPVYLSGHSLGAIIAAGAVAFCPRVPAANISAGGGSLPTNLFMRSEVFGYFIDMLKPPDTTDADVRRFMPILQLLVERGDPANLARLATAEPPTGLAGAVPKQVLFQEVIDDGFVPNASNEALGRALGQDHLEPVVRDVFGLTPIAGPASGNHPSGVTAAFFQFDVLADGSVADHTSIYADEVAQYQWIHFFTTHLASDQAEAVDPYAALGIERD